MAFQRGYQGRTFIADTRSFDQGLRRHMVSVYNTMMVGLVISGAVSYATAHSPAMMQAIYGSGLRMLVPFLPFAFLLVLQMGIRNLSTAAASVTFSLFCASMGLSLSWIYLMYAEGSIAQIFFVSAAMFAGTSLYGYTTKADLTRVGSLMFMALIGLVIGGIVNLFIHSGPLGFLLSAAAVVVFTGLTAFDTQKIRDSYSEGYGIDSNRKLAILGALRLYLDFINMFVALLQLFGMRRQ